MPEGRADGMPTSAVERRLRRMLGLRVAMPHTYMDDGEMQGQEHGISIDFMREPVADIEAKILALNLSRFGDAEGVALSGRNRTWHKPKERSMPFQHSFMQPEIDHTFYYEVETSHGTWIVPEGVGYFPIIPQEDYTYTDEHPEWESIEVAFHDFIGSGRIKEVTPKIGWIARLSTPGCMDCTDWSAHDTEQEAIDYLEETYGGDE